MEQVSNITAFNTDPLTVGKVDLENVKLASKVIDRQEDDETIKRLDTWCEAGMDKPPETIVSLVLGMVLTLGIPSNESAL